MSRSLRVALTLAVVAALAACTPVRVGVKTTTTVGKGAVKVTAGAAKTVF